MPPLPDARLASPALAQRVLLRPRLLRLLSTGALGPVTLVHGPSGSGKTVVTASWVAAREEPGPVAWLTLGHDTHAPGPFWAHLLEALRRSGVVVDDVGVPAGAEEVDRGLLARIAGALADSPHPVVLVLDQFDLVSPAGRGAELDFVLGHATGHLRLVVLSRGRPPLRLARRRAAGELTEIGPAELAFTPEEAAALLLRHGAELSGDEVEDLVRRTDGWAAGLRLIALSLQRGADLTFVHDQLGAGQGEAVDFLLAEVVDTLPAQVQDLLVRCCLLDRVTGDLADALTGRLDGQHTFLELAEAGVFVRALPADQGETRWFRVQELLASALQSRLRRTEPDLVPQLHRTASHWLASDGQVTDAVAHAVAAGDWSLAAGLVVDHLAVGHLLVGLQTHRLAELLAAMPRDSHDPYLALVEAALAMARLDPAACREALRRAEATGGDVPPSRSSAFRLGICTLRVIVSRLSADLATAEAAGAEARELFLRVPADRLAAHPELPALVLSSLGTLQLWAGSPDDAEETLRAGLLVAEGAFTEQSRANCLGQLAVLHYLRGELRAADAKAMAAVEHLGRAGLPHAARVPVGHLAAAAVAGEWHDLPDMRLHLDAAESSVAVRRDPSLGLMAALLRGRYQRLRGDVQGARYSLHAATGLREAVAPSSFAVGLSGVEQARAELSCGDVDGAEATLARLPPADPEVRVASAEVMLEQARPTHALATLAGLVQQPGLAPVVEVRVRLVRAQALQAAGGSAGADEAVEELGQALELARAEVIRRPFVEAAVWTRRMLAAEPHLASLHGWLDAGLLPPQASTGDKTDVPAVVVEPLTPREIEVLSLVATPMTTQEAADALHLSVNTVKTHLAAAYRKLASPRRTEAVRRARALGLL